MNKKFTKAPSYQATPEQLKKLLKQKEIEKRKEELAYKRELASYDLTNY